MGRDLIRELIRQPLLSMARVSARARAAAISVYGDEVRNKIASDEMQASLRSKVAITADYGRPLERLTTPLHQVKRFVQRMREKSIQVFLFWPAALEMKAATSAQNIQNYRDWNRLLTKEGLIVLNEPDDLLFPAELMFDAVNHPNALGRVRATRTLVEALNRAICESSGHTIPGGL